MCNVQYFLFAVFFLQEVKEASNNDTSAFTPVSSQVGSAVLS